jgi:hypothetical protein
MVRRLRFVPQSGTFVSDESKKKEEAVEFSNASLSKC